MSEKYTYADVIIDPEDPRVEIGAEYYFADNPRTVLSQLEDYKAIPRKLAKVSPNDSFPFWAEGGCAWACLIRKKEPEKKYVPFDLSKEEDRTKLRGAWVRIKTIPAVEYQITGLNSMCAFLSNGEGQTMIALLGAFEFLDGSLCGRLVEEE